MKWLQRLFGGTERFEAEPEKASALQGFDMDAYLEDLKRRREAIEQLRQRSISEPEPDWGRRMLAAWQGTLEHSRQEAVGPLPLPDGKLLVGDPGSIHSALEIPLPPGDYFVSVAIAHFPASDGSEEDERISHAFVYRSREAGIALLEPLTAADGSEMEIGVDSGLACFVAKASVPKLEALYGGMEAVEDRLFEAMAPTLKPSLQWGQVSDGENPGAFTGFSAGWGDGTYPLARFADAEDKTVAIALDLLVGPPGYGIKWPITL